MNSPRVTIGITCYNAEDTILRAIKSAQAQDWPDLEIVVVDDCSSDGSAAVVKSAVTRDDRVRFIRHPENTGPAGARNTILHHASGEFVAFFDDDDESEPARAGVQVRAILDYEARGDAKLIACHASGVRKYANGYSVDLPAIGSRAGAEPNGPDLAAYLLIYRRRQDWFYGSGTPACSLMARQTTFLAAGGFDQDLRRVEDADFAIRLALMGGHFIGTSESLIIQHSTGAPDKSPEKNFIAEQRLAEKYAEYLTLIGGLYHARYWPALRYWHFKRRPLRMGLTLFGLLARNPFYTLLHLAATAPRRVRHERQIRQK
jgi:glycosyltransferase involved in cell wall biosynthesis